MHSSGRPFLLLFALAFPLALRAQVTAIKAGTLIDPETGGTAASQVILVDSGKVKAVGGNLAIPPAPR